ncbi:TPA: hypothetical protein ACGUO9_004531 [Vibrio vulnificus]
MSNSEIIAKSDIPAYKTKESFILALILLSLFVTLFVRGFLTETGFLVSIVVTSFVSIVVYFSGKVVHVKMQKFELILHDMKKTESSIKELATLVVNVIESSRDNVLELNTGIESEFDNDLEKLKKLAKES